ncbi:MAG: hypothetical protein GY713_08280 [Actinomycetia bacterium]|nr:hypothetical protein [Actinomycetes bacterium]
MTPLDRPTLALDREEQGYDDDHECSGPPLARCPSCFREHGTGCDPGMVRLRSCPLCANSTCGWCLDHVTGLCADCREPERREDLDEGGKRGWSVRELDLLVGIDTITLLSSIDVTTLLAVDADRRVEIDCQARLGRSELDRFVDSDSVDPEGPVLELPPDADASVRGLAIWLRDEVPPLPAPVLVQRVPVGVSDGGCDTCGASRDLVCCDICLGPSCGSCRVGARCPTCVVVVNGRRTAVDGLPEGLLLEGLDAVVATDGRKTVVAAAGARRRELIVLREGRVTRWDHLGPGSVDELCLLLASESEQGDLGLEIDDRVPDHAEAPVVQVTVRLVGDHARREATYPVTIGPADATVVGAALRGLTPEWSGERPTAPDPARAELLDGVLPEMRGEPVVWLEMRVEPVIGG